MEENNEKTFDELDSFDNEEESTLVSPSMEEDEIRTLSNQIKHDKVLKKEDEEKVFEISDAKERIPRVRDNNGQVIPPKQMSPTDKTKVGYPSVLMVFLKDTNYIINVSGLTYFWKKENGKNVYEPWFRTDVRAEDIGDQYTSQLTELFYKFCLFKKLDIAKTSRDEFKQKLIGMKIKVKNKKGKFQGKEYEKIQIIDFVE